MFILILSNHNPLDLVYSYAIPDLPGGICTLTRLSRPNTDTNSEISQSVASSTFSYDYAVPESPKKLKEVGDEVSKHNNSKIDPSLRTENHNSKSTVMSGDSVRSNNSGPYYHVLGDKSMHKDIGNDSSKKEQPYDTPEAVINAAFEDIEATVVAKENCKENKAELYLPSIKQTNPHDLPAGHRSDSKISDCPVTTINEKTKEQKSWKEKKGEDSDLQNIVYENETCKATIESTRPELPNGDSENGEMVKELISNHEKDSDTQKDEDAKKQEGPKYANVDVLSNYC